ncbi:hypothetical protein [Bradyrhizobium retamae]|uniref:Uncharacterized protein n=1 Tax=Bradyrhizobium retamae TaxID=1300035 RepID=A0A0R3N1Y5_9BRAD|nr:hypothetical protein [Bradyrhizobium retamae]KRR25932.1 hypothetical protein CQ13_23190 [Bradyrhizobium retamae]
MGGELHEGVVAFRPLTPGREAVMLGRVQVGEISPTQNPAGRFPVCFRLNLPDCSSQAWRPARTIADAQRQAIDKINDWLNAADLRPNGAA